MVSGLINTYPDTLAMMYIHVGAAQGDPYTTAWGNQRQNYYADQYIPDMWYDSVSHPYYTTSLYLSQLNARQAIPTDVTIALFSTENGAQTYDITARVCVEASGTEHSMRIYMVQVLDHYPATPTYERNTVRQGATTEDVDVEPGFCVDVTRTFTFDAASWNQQADIKIVGWAQDPVAHPPGNVYQAAVMSWPFTPFAPIFANAFDTGDTSDWSNVVP